MQGPGVAETAMAKVAAEAKTATDSAMAAGLNARRLELQPLARAMP